MRLRLLAFAFCLAFSAGCPSSDKSAGAKALSYTEDARKAYEEAMKAFRGKDWEGARALFQEVRKNFPQSRYARLSELRIADIDFAQDKFTDAIAAYRAFAQTYRTDREAEYARYRLTKSLFFDISDTILQPPAEERDQAVTADAHRELRAFLKAYPRSRWRKEVEYMLEVVTGRLVRHELYVARYYRRRDNFDATIARIDYALKNFPSSGLDPEALVLKGETLMMMNRRKEAKQVFEVVIKDWGGPFAVTAKAFLDELKEPSQDPPKIRRPADPGPAPPAPAPKPGTGKPLQTPGPAAPPAK
jgi:outer membrane protein assembly factor BamD